MLMLLFYRIRVFLVYRRIILIDIKFELSKYGYNVYFFGVIILLFGEVNIFEN